MNIKIFHNILILLFFQTTLLGVELSLRQIGEMALSKNKQVAYQKRELEITKLRRSDYFIPYFPSIQIQTAAADTLTLDALDSRSFSTKIGVDQLITDWGKHYKQMVASERKGRTQRLALISETQKLEDDAIASGLQLLLMKEEFRIGSAMVELATKQASHGKRERELGQLLETEYLLLLSSQKKTEIEMLEKKFQLAMAEETLKFKLRLEPTQNLQIRETFSKDFLFNEPKFSKESLIQKGMDLSLERKKSYDEFLESKEMVATKRLENLPTLRGQFYATLRGESYPPRTYGLGGSISIHWLFYNTPFTLSFSRDSEENQKRQSSGGNGSANLFSERDLARGSELAKLAVERKQAEMIDLSRQVNREMRQLIETIELQYNKLRVSKENVDIGSQRLRIMEKRVELGEEKRTELIKEHIDFVASETSYYREIVEYLLTVQLLERKTGTPFLGMGLVTIGDPNGNVEN